MKHITIAIVALSLFAANLATAQDEIVRDMPAEDTGNPSSIKQLGNKYVIECVEMSVCGVSANTICPEGYDVDYITGSDAKYKMVIKCKKEVAPAATAPTPAAVVPAAVTVPVTVTVPTPEPEPEPEPYLEVEQPEPEEPSNGLGLRIAGSIFLGDSVINLLAAPIYCDSLSYDEYGYFDSEYYNSCLGVAGTFVIVEATFGAVLLSSGIIKKAVVKSKTNKKISTNGHSLLVRF